VQVESLSSDPLEDERKSDVVQGQVRHFASIGYPSRIRDIRHMCKHVWQCPYLGTNSWLAGGNPSRLNETVSQQIPMALQPALFLYKYRELNAKVLE
jgi:hypothetical protein